jgi:hypothetical protein
MTDTDGVWKPGHLPSLGPSRSSPAVDFPSLHSLLDSQDQMVAPL